MCGLLGILNSNKQTQITLPLLNFLGKKLSHRGPNGQGEYIDSDVALVHTRLAIIDINNGSQPMKDIERETVIAYNGEIYNFKEVRETLSRLGYIFRTKCDTEVVLKAYSEWGVDCLERLNGMFAFAIWDSKNKKIFLARDRLGIKPLYYSRLDNGQFLFSSELGAMMHHPQFNLSLSNNAINLYFGYGYVPEPHSIFNNCYKLKAGHYIFADINELEPIQKIYWDLKFGIQSLSFEQWQELILDKIDKAVHSRLIADVPIGALLSGGVDSSSVVASAKRKAGELKTFSVGFKDKDFDESKFASIVSRQCETEHHNTTLDHPTQNILSIIGKTFHEPFADSSAIPSYLLCNEVSRKLKVVLTGDGGDEGFAGYRRYTGHCMEEKVRSYLPIKIRAPLFGNLSKFYPNYNWMPRPIRAQSTFNMLSLDSIKGYYNNVSFYKDHQRLALLNPDFIEQCSFHPDSLLKSHAANGPNDPLSLIQYLDIKSYLVGDILTKVDRVSMANGLEARIPLLDHELLECISQLPRDLKIHRGNTKWMLKSAMSNRLPQSILHRKKKGFSIPLSNWIKDIWHSESVSLYNDSKLLQMGIINENYIKSMVTNHISGHRDYATQIYSLLMFESFIANLDSIKKERYAHTSCTRSQLADYQWI